MYPCVEAKKYQNINLKSNNMEQLSTYDIKVMAGNRFIIELCEYAAILSLFLPHPILAGIAFGSAGSLAVQKLLENRRIQNSIL